MQKLSKYIFKVCEKYKMYIESKKAINSNDTRLVCLKGVLEKKERRKQVKDI